MNNSCLKPTDSRCVFFSRKKKCFWKHRKEKKLNFNFGYDFVPQRENKSERWNFIGGFGRERRAAMFLVPWTAFQKLQSEFAQVLGRASKEAAFPSPSWSLGGLCYGCGVAESGVGLRMGHTSNYVGSWCLLFTWNWQIHFPLCCLRVASNFQIPATKREKDH